MPTSVVQRFQSLRHALSLRLSRRLRWSRGDFREQPAGELLGLTPAEQDRIAELRRLFGVNIAGSEGATTARNNYAYLDALEHAYRAFGEQPTRGAVVVDVGCANFWYAASLHAFFRPERLHGIEIDGYRRYRDGHTRRDYAQGHVRDLTGACFRVADFADLDLPADVISAWFPFVTAGPLLAWRLPLSALRPAALFASVRRNLRPGGRFLMVNQGETEFQAASRYAVDAGLERHRDIACLDLRLVERTLPAVLSLWRPHLRRDAPDGDSAGSATATDVVDPVRP